MIVKIPSFIPREQEFLEFSEFTVESEANSDL